MGEARRRKLAGDTKPKGKAWRVYKPSRFVRILEWRDGRWRPIRW